jgi:hypothetical protein
MLGIRLCKAQKDAKCKPSVSITLSDTVLKEAEYINKILPPALNDSSPLHQKYCQAHLTPLMFL